MDEDQFVVRWTKGESDLKDAFNKLVARYCVDKSKLSRELLRAWVEWEKRHNRPVRFPIRIEIKEIKPD